MYVSCYWTVHYSYSMPDAMRNSEEWKFLLPKAAGTEQNNERERVTIIRNWLWETVLPLIPESMIASEHRQVWQTMLNEWNLSTMYSALAENDLRYGIPLGKILRMLHFGYIAYFNGSNESAAANYTQVVHFCSLDMDIEDFWNLINPIGLFRKLVEA